MKKRNVLITGSEGFLGIWFEKLLMDDGWTDFSYVDTVNGGQDARDFFAREWRRRYELVIHCAAHVKGRFEIENNSTFLGARNAQIDGAFFEWLLRAEPTAAVYLSSSAVYPIRFQQGEFAASLREGHVSYDSPEKPDETYGAVKLFYENLAANVNSLGRTRVSVVRPFSGYGPGQSENYPFPSFRVRARERQSPFKVWGSGKQVRDWIHVRDLVKATLAIVERGVTVPVNICTGIGTSMDDLAKLFMNAAGYQADISHISTVEGVRYRVGDPTEMMRYYVPEISIEEGVRRAMQ